MNVLMHLFFEQLHSWNVWCLIFFDSLPIIFMIQIQGEDIVFIVAPLYHVLDPNFFAILFGRKSLELVCKKSGNNVSKSTKMSQKSYVSEAKIQIWKVTGIPRKIVSEKNVKKNMRLFDRFLNNVGTVAQLLHPIEIWVLTFLSIVSYLNVYAT